MGNNEKAGFTLIEAIMVIAIIGILSVSAAYLLVSVVRNSVFIPNKLNMDMVACDALRIMIEGEGQAKGLRFSRTITSIQDNRLTFNNQDNQSIRYRLDTSTDKLYCSVAGGSESLIPYYTSSGISLTGKNNRLFSYYDANEALTSNPANVRRIKISLIAQTGTGSYQDWEGQSEQSSSIAVKRFP